MSESLAVQTIVAPAPAFDGRRTASRPNEFAKTARFWCPQGVTLEPPVATVSRYACRLIDNRTGLAYSVEELVDSFGVVTSVAGKTGNVVLGIEDIDDLLSALNDKVPLAIENDGPPNPVQSASLAPGLTYSGDGIGPLEIPRVGTFNGRDLFKLTDPAATENAFFIYWSISGTSWVLIYASVDSVPEDGTAVWLAQNSLDEPFPGGLFVAQSPEGLSGSASVTHNPVTSAEPGQFVFNSENPDSGYLKGTEEFHKVEFATPRRGIVSLAAELGTFGDSTLEWVDPTIGEDFTVRIQAVLDKALQGPLRLFWNGIYSHTGLILHPNTQIIAAPNCGAVLRSDSDTFLFANANWKGLDEGRDKGISIQGGIWHCNGRNQTREGLDNMWTVGMRFFHVEDVTLDGIEIRVQPSFALHIHDWRNVRFTNSIIDHGVNHGVSPGSNTDGIHLHGGQGIYSNNCRFSTGDDAIALNADDWTTVYGDYATGGDILDAVFENVVVEDAYQVLRVLSSHSRIDNVNIRNVSGKAERVFIIDSKGESFPAMQPRGLGNIGDVVLENWSVECTNDDREYAVTGGTFDRIVLDGFQCGVSKNPYTAFMVDGDGESLEVKNLDIEMTGGDFRGFRIEGRVQDLVMDGVKVENPNTPFGGSVVFVQSQPVSVPALGVRTGYLDRITAIGLAHILNGDSTVGDMRIGRIANKRTFGTFGGIYLIQPAKLLEVQSYVGSGPVNGYTEADSQIGLAFGTTGYAEGGDYSLISRLSIPLQITGATFASQEFLGAAWTEAVGEWVGEYYGMAPSTNGDALGVDVGRDGDFEIRSTIFYKLGGSILVAIRYVDADNWTGVRVTDDAIELISKVSGVETVNGTTSTSALTPRAGDWSSIRVILSAQGTGSGVKVYGNAGLGVFGTLAKESGVAGSGETEVRFIAEAGDVLVGSTIISRL